MVQISIERRIFQVINYLLLLLLCASIILPFMHVIAVSLSDAEEVKKLNVGIWPKGFLLGAYKTVVTDEVFLRSFINTVFITVVTSVASILVNLLAAYAFSREFFGKKILNYVFVVTLFFSGGLIPTYILMTKYLGLYNRYAALILPSIVSFYTIIIMKSQIATVPQSLFDSAVIDGASDFKTAFYIVIPSVLPTIAALGMFTALGIWNSWFGVLIYTDKREMWTLQYFLRALVIEKSLYYAFLSGTGAGKNLNPLLDTSSLTARNYEMAAIIVIALPVVVIYPFIQKYFVKGILVGSIKE